MLFELIESDIKIKFPTLQFDANEAEGLITIPANNSDVGDIAIQDDKFEATVYICNFTHAHFGCYEDGFTEEQKNKYIVDSVVEFLQDMFNDQIVMWGSHENGGGYYLKGDKSKLLFRKQREEWVWSGPVTINKAKQQWWRRDV